MPRLILLLTAGLLACSFHGNPRDVDLDKIKLPPGFEISIFAEDVPNARSLRLTPGGTLFVSTRREGKVYAVRDTDGDYVADEVYTLAEGLNMPNGIAFRDGALYVAEVNRILRYDDIERRLADPPEPVVVYDDLPSDRHHGWKYIDFGPDGKLYVPVGAPCNICDEGDPYAAILRMNPDGSDVEVFARGVRNTVGFTWDPLTGEMWFTDNGRDNIGGQNQDITDNSPPCELNHAPRAGMHFGYPYVHGRAILDPEFGAGHDPADYTPPARELGPHVAPLGLEFYTGEMFPGEYRNQIFIAEHGSWNRRQKIGYRVTLVRLDENRRPTSYEPFAEGWLEGNDNWGRPVDLELMPDGSMLLSDDQNGVVYRITYTGR
ncbi:sorbosone dehydrogenase family protein [Rhodocaloribacter litoris]|uniref:PQQ-dependent sugar dehydrogenase n=1 Tax=Rhodocaloribacter litoris TaxID=2558931 RepID=UPI00142453C3|nr:sorbosone dehydrogenase family protein [Rhodocaloribacter litoris]QXD17055.1 sorbosone dehydrogenase family protein [Rhodocaloribacter litoris]